MTIVGADAARHRVRVGEDGEVMLAWGIATDIGRRRQANEDSAIALSPVWAVADGMGGHSAGDLASAAIVRRLEDAAGRFSGVGEIDVVLDAISLAADDVDELAEDTIRGAGSTVTGAVLVLDDGEPAFEVVNIGDSRVYRFERNELRQVTVDHSVVQELVDAGLVAAEDADQHPESNVITRAVGFRETPEPDRWTIPAVEGLRLLMCSDGLTKEIGPDRIRLHLAAGLTASSTASALVDAAVAAGGRDNVTVVVVDVVSTRA